MNLVHEPVSLWQKVERKGKEEQDFNILERFYKNPNRYAYTFQHYVFMTRFLQEERSRKTKLPIRIMERSVCSDRNVFTEVLYEKGWLSELEYSLYEAWYWPTIEVGEVFSSQFMVTSASYLGFPNSHPARFYLFARHTGNMFEAASESCTRRRARYRSCVPTMSAS